VKRTLLASVALGLAGILTWGCDSTGGILGGAGPIVAPPAPDIVNYLVYAVNEDGNLINFNIRTPEQLNNNIPLTGLDPGETVLGIDFRPRNQQLYAVTSNGRVCHINTLTGLVSNIANAGPVFAPLGTGDIDFNPQVDRIRFVSTANQNIRLNPNDGSLTAVDGDLFFDPGEPPGDPEVVACAYTNNVFNAASTELFNFDHVRALFYLQNLPNTGRMSRQVAIPNGIQPSPLVGFDITDNNTGLATFAEPAGTFSGLFSVDIASKTVASLGIVGGGSRVVTLSAQPAFGPTVANFVGVDSNNNLVKFNSATPNVLDSSIAITGLVDAGEIVVGCDFRTANNNLVVVTRAAANEARLYTVNPDTGVASLVDTLRRASSLPDPALLPIDSFQGVDFNPTVDRLRIVSTTRDIEDPPVPLKDNYRVNVANANAIEDGPLAYVAGDSNEGNVPFIGAAAYTNNFIGASATQLFVIDHGNDQLVLQNPANNGSLNTVGPLNVDVNEHVNFDISDLGEAWMTTGTIDPTEPSVLCRVNLNTGSATPVANVGGTFLRAFTIVPRT